MGNVGYRYAGSGRFGNLVLVVGVMEMLSKHPARRFLHDMEVMR